MKKIFIAPFDLLSHYLRSIEFARFLSKYHDVEITFLRSQHYNHFVESNGFKTTQETVSVFKNVIQNAAQFNPNLHMKMHNLPKD